MRRSFVFFCCALLVGCWSKQDERILKAAGLPDAPAKLVGKWKIKSDIEAKNVDSSAEEKAVRALMAEMKSLGTKTLDFTSGKTVILQSHSQQVVGTFELNNSELTLKDRNGWSDTYGLEFGSDGELILRPAGTGHGVKSLFDGLEGRWQRTSPLPAQFDEKGNTGPLADAKGTVSKFEKKRLALAPLLEKAFTDRDDLVAKLREAGIKTPADLKGNFRGQQLAGSLQRLSGEIDGLERQIAAIDTAILETKAVVRRMEREQAGISEAEMRKLAEQLRDAEERTDGAGKLVTPLDVEAALERAMKAIPKAYNPSKKQTTEANESPTGPVTKTDSSLRPQDKATVKDYLTRSAKTKAFNVLVEEGKSYRIDLKSSQIDSYLFVKFNGQTMAQDDDSGEKLNARIIFQPRQTGVYQIEATSLGGVGVGVFTLEVQRE